MDMVKLNAGKLRAAGYDAKARLLQVQLDDGVTLQYRGVGEETWRQLRYSSSAWSYYRDNIEESYASARVTTTAASKPGKNPLDDLFDN